VCDRVLPLGESYPSGGLLCIVVIAGSVVMAPLIAALERRRLRRARARFLRGRPTLPDDAFLSRLGLSANEATFFLAARRAMAEPSGVPAEMIHPEDTWRSLMDLQFDNGFLEDIVFGLERELGARLPYAYPTDDRLPFVVYVRQLAVCLERETKGSGVDSRKLASPNGYGL
jgi:hypothetical protein